MYTQPIDFSVNLVERCFRRTEGRERKRETVSRNEPDGFPFVCPENGNGEICSSVSQKLRAPEELTVTKVNSMSASLFRTVISYPEGHPGARWKGCEFPEHVVVLPKSFLFLPSRIPFSLLTPHPSDRNSKYFAEMSSNTRGIKQRSKNKFLNPSIVFADLFLIAWFLCIDFEKYRIANIGILFPS